MVEEGKPITKHDLAWQEVIKFASEDMTWRLSDAGFIKVDDKFVKQPFTLESFTKLCLRWQVLSQPFTSSRPNVTISEEVASYLPRLSNPTQISHAARVGWSFLGLRLDDIFSRPTTRRNDLKFEDEVNGMKTVVYQDDFLYLLILQHLEVDVRRLAIRTGVKPEDWIVQFQARLGVLANRRFPGLWDDSPVDIK